MGTGLFDRGWPLELCPTFMPKTHHAVTAPMCDIYFLYLTRSKKNIVHKTNIFRVDSEKIEDEYQRFL